MIGHTCAVVHVMYVIPMKFIKSEACKELYVIQSESPQNNCRIICYEYRIIYFFRTVNVIQLIKNNKGELIMHSNKNVLLIAGGGTLGTYVSKELLRLGCNVDVICLEEKKSESDRLKFYKDYVSEDLLKKLFSQKHYDGIVNFIHYTDVEEYKKFHKILIENTDHLIFLSSYRVYADKEHPIKETSPRLYDVSEDKYFLETEDYAVPKSKCEDFLSIECKGQPWTVVRPVISFSDKRFDLYVYSNDDILNSVNSGKPLLMPEFAKNVTAGIDWAGNSGKLIANLLFKKEAIGERFTISSGQNLTWGEVADIYSDLTGLKIEWTDEESFISSYPCVKTTKEWIYKCDRLYDRSIDCSKVLSVTGLGKNDFLSIRKGIEKELEIFEQRNKKL